MKRKGIKIFALIFLSSFAVLSGQLSITAVASEVEEHVPEVPEAAVIDNMAIQAPKPEMTEAERLVNELELDLWVMPETEDITAEGGQRNFSYVCTRVFEEMGIQIHILSEENVIPEDVEIQIILVEDIEPEYIEEAVQRMAEEELKERAREATGSTLSIFNMYANLEVSGSSSYVVQIEVSYKDEQGNDCVLRPEEDGSLEIMIEALDSEERSGDELQSVEVFNLMQDMEVFSDEWGENPPSVYTISTVKYAATADADMIAAEQRAWDIINGYADTEYYLTDPYKEEMTEEQYEELHQAALKATAACSTQFEKIKAITGFVADRIYYDHYYLEDKANHPLYVSPYDVYAYKRTVCAGYARLMRTLCISLGIPCMDIIGDNHEYNAIYDSDQQKWIFSDATWCSYNTYNVDSDGNELWDYRGYGYSVFNLEPEGIALLNNHEVYGVYGLEDGVYHSVYYGLVTPTSDWAQMDWKMVISGIGNASAAVITAVDELAGFPVTEVNSWAFANRSDITGSIKLPESITKIGSCAFYNCSGLTGGLELPTGITSIGEWAFANCSNLTGNLLLLEGLASIERYAFSNCSGLNGNLTLPKGLTSIESCAFYNCSGLTGGLELPEGLTSIGSHAFYNCSSLNGSLLLPKGLTSIESYAFYNCSGLTGDLKLPESLTSIESHAFYNCSGLTGNLKLPEGLTSIESHVFCNCSGLTGGLELPTGVTSIGEWAFANCSNLTGNLLLPEGLSDIGEVAFYKCSGLTGSLTLPASLLSIGDFAFSDCSGFEGDLKLPLTVKSIGNYAFQSCHSLKSIFLTKSIESIGTGAFSRMSIVYAPEGSYAEKYANDNNYTCAKKYAEYEACFFYLIRNDDVVCRDSIGNSVINDFKCDGIYTYYFQADGTAMKDRLSYHPDGIHVIYFDKEGHEVFDNFAYVGHNIPSMQTGIATELKEYCYFNTYGYQYTDVVTYDTDLVNPKLYYANTSGVLERGGWFTFSETVKYAGNGTLWSAAGQRGYANADCTLLKDTYCYDEQGNVCYMQGNGAVIYQ